MNKAKHKKSGDGDGDGGGGGAGFVTPKIARVSKLFSG